MIEAIDGEAIEGRYSLMRCSDGRELMVSGMDLHTLAIFHWLASPKPYARYCCFGSNYDVNMWLRDLTFPHLKRLWETGTVQWNGWRIEWIPSKLFLASHFQLKIGFRVEESWGFFQKPFIQALEQWNIDCPEVIEWGKRERVDFKLKDLPQASAYCLAECEALRDLMIRVRDCSRKVGLEPSSWIGPGALASDLLKRNGVAKHHTKEQSIPGWPDAHTAALSAYFGGRVEAFTQGKFENVHAYDISSAYPFAMLSLPSSRQTSIKKTGYNKSAHFAVYRCRWKVDTRVTPFPVRQGTSIWYPASGEGWYHASEVNAALQIWPDIEVLDGFRLVTSKRKHEFPFDFVPHVYRERVKLLSEGDMAGQMLKLALNSCYGKLAQSRSGMRTPRWRNFWWAGEITAATRARILELIAFAHVGRPMFESLPLLIATDGIVFQHQLPAITTKGELGGWEHTEYDKLSLLAPGVYSYTIDGSQRLKSRGFFSRDVDWDELERMVLAGETYRYDIRRFIGIGAALARKDPKLWRQWEAQNDRALVCRLDRRVFRDGDFWPISEFLVSEPYRAADESLYAELNDEMDQPDLYRE